MSVSVAVRNPWELLQRLKLREDIKILWTEKWGITLMIIFEIFSLWQSTAGGKHYLFFSWISNRFSKFLLSKISKVCSRSKHKFAENFSDEADSYGKASMSDLSNMLNEVCALKYWLSVVCLCLLWRNE